MKMCERKAIVGHEEILPGVSVSFRRVVLRGAVRIPVWETWCGDRVPVSGSWELDEGDSLPPGAVECEECRKAKAAAGGDVEEPPKA